MIKCKICNENIKPLGMPSHLTRKHNISSKEYYDTYCKVDQEGICKVCRKPTSFRGVAYGYSKYCGPACANNDPDTQEKIKQTTLKHFGVKHALQSTKIKDKVKKTCLDKYGVDSFMKTTTFRNKTVEVIKTDDVKNKRKQTNLSKYGVDIASKSKEVQDKIKQTNLEKYGSSNIFSSEYGKQKIKETNLSRYGCENGGASKQAQEKIKNTRYKHILDFCKQNNCVPLTDINVDYSVKDSIFHNRLLLYNDRYFVKKEDIDEIISHIPTSTGQSVIENNIAKYIESIYSGQIIRNTRTVIRPKELDVYLPELQIAIEVDGLFYHSTNNYTPKDYHLLKTKACEDKGIRLIHITEYEWLNKQEICKSIIASAIGKSQTKIYARNCEIKNVTQNEADNFLNINHIQGKIKATCKIGLYYKNELVMLICLGRSRFNKNEIELLRMCTKLNTQVIGGFSKLLKAQPYNTFISYIDRAKFDGNSYKKVGFTYISETAPSYKYYKQDIELNRITAQKHKLKELLGKQFKESETESQNMIRNGWLQVYDCGTIKVKYERTM